MILYKLFGINEEWLNLICKKHLNIKIKLAVSQSMSKKKKKN